MKPMCFKIFNTGKLYLIIGVFWRLIKYIYIKVYWNLVYVNIHILKFLYIIRFLFIQLIIARIYPWVYVGVLLVFVL